MEIKNIQKKETKSVTISVRTYKDYSKWMDENKVSPTALFNEAIEELMKKEK